MSSSPQPTIKQQEKFWDWHWQHWQERRTVNQWKQTRHEKVLEFVKSVAVTHPRILDLGCGPGWYTDQLAQFGDVTGIDLSESAINMARQRFPNINFIAANLYEYSLGRQEFDIVVCQEVIDHVENTAALVQRVAEILKPNGYFVLSCTNKFVVDRLDERQFPSQPAHHIGRYLNIKGIKAHLSPQFFVSKLETIIPMGNKGILRIVNSTKLNALLGVITPTTVAERLKERLGFGYQIVILAQKKR